MCSISPDCDSLDLAAHNSFSFLKLAWNPRIRMDYNSSGPVCIKQSEMLLKGERREINNQPEVVLVSAFLAVPEEPVYKPIVPKITFKSSILLKMYIYIVSIKLTEL